MVAAITSGMQVNAAANTQYSDTVRYQFIFTMCTKGTKSLTDKTLFFF